jgi:hypothetical protein
MCRQFLPVAFTRSRCCFHQRFALTHTHPRWWLSQDADVAAALLERNGALESVCGFSGQPATLNFSGMELHRDDLELVRSHSNPAAGWNVGPNRAHPELICARMNSFIWFREIVPVYAARVPVSV